MVQFLQSEVDPAQEGLPGRAGQEIQQANERIASAHGTTVLSQVVRMPTALTFDVDRSLPAIAPEENRQTTGQVVAFVSHQCPDDKKRPLERLVKEEEHEVRQANQQTLCEKAEERPQEK